MTKTPKETLKAHPVYHEDLVALDEFVSAPPNLAEDLANSCVRMILAMTLVQDALTAAERERIAQPSGTAMVVSVPGPDWVEPIAQALTRIGRWGITFRRKGGKMAEKPDTGSDETANVLGNGLNALGVSHEPARYLPASLSATADICIDLQPPGPRVLRAVIELVTGMRCGRVPDDAARGLAFDEVAACLRRGTKPSACLRRLAAASKAKFRGDPALDDVPTLDRLQGMAPAVEWGLALAAGVEDWRQGGRAWKDLPERCAVVSGPAGCGKSSWARSLAKTLKMPLVSTSVASWFSSGGYLDQVIRQFETVIGQAVAVAPAVLFLDEIDTIPNRASLDGRNAEYFNTLVSRILLALDSAVSGETSSLIVIGATNYPERLDDALIRPGRLNRVIPIPPLDAHGIAGIMRQHLGDDLPGADLVPLAIIGGGATGAETASWVKGARSAALAERRPMALADLVARIAPPETRSPTVQLAVARHEAGHAVSTSALLVGTIESVSIVGRGRFAGRTNARLRAVESMTADELDAFVISVLCGRAADEHWGAASSGAAGGPGSDLAIATGLIACKHGSYGLGATLTYRAGPNEVAALVERDPVFRAVVEADLKRLYEAAQGFVSENAAVINVIARRLVQSRILSGAEIRDLVGAQGVPTIPDDARLIEVGGAHG
ncbi:ATP-dependent zinc metalloprotease FtsH [Methylorubrum aminovorans]